MPRPRRPLSALVLLVGFGLPVASSAQSLEEGPGPSAPEASAPPQPAAPVYRSSLGELVEEVARALEARAGEEGVQGPVQLETATGRGLDGRRVDRVFTSRLERRLRAKRVLLPVAEADLKVRVVLSLEGSRLWAVGLLEGAALPGPSSMAVSRAMDRELATLFGKASGQGRTRWVLERLGPIPAGVLDVVLTDVDDDLVDDLVVLGVDGVRAFRYSPSDSRPAALGDVHPLPGKRRWPKTVLGWAAADRDGAVWIATSAGHRFRFEPAKGRFTRASGQGVPLQQVIGDATDAGPALVLARGWYGSPTLAQPYTRPGKAKVETGGLPPFVRDLVRWPGRDIWVWVDESGRVGAWQKTGRPVVLGGVERSGDRIVLADLDGDGEGELATSAARAPGEGDQLTLYRLDPKLTRQTVAFRSRLSGGDVVALAVGDLDLDERPDLIIVEEPGGDEAVVWRLEYAP